MKEVMEDYPAVSQNQPFEKPAVTIAGRRIDFVGLREEEVAVFFGKELLGVQRLIPEKQVFDSGVHAPGGVERRAVPVSCVGIREHPPVVSCGPLGDEGNLIIHP